MSISELGALIVADPGVAKGKIMSALEAARGDRQAAASALGTTQRSLYRYIERLKLWDDLDHMITEKGFPRVAGPPRSSDRIRDAVLSARGSIARAAHALEMDPDTLRARITELDLWDDLNRRLTANGLRPMSKPALAAGRA